MSWIGRLLFGNVQFAPDEEYQGFQYKVLCFALVSGSFFTLLFILGNHFDVNPIIGAHVYTMQFFATAAVILWWWLRGQPQRFWVIGWLYEACCLIEYVSCLLWVARDELRILWFFTNVPGVYLLLGQRAGALIASGMIVSFIVANPHLPDPYSPNAVATAVVAMTYIAAFFHLYGNRLHSYFSRLQASNQALSRLAREDSLTGLLNARTFDETCERYFHLAKREQRLCALLFVDLDHFKRINDTYGHAAGDMVLKSVAQLLLSSARQSDVCGRVGGEEFCVLLPDTDQAGAEVFAESLRQKIEALMPVLDDEARQITASIGVTTRLDSDAGFKSLQQRADSAMYEAKQTGRNRVSVV